MRTKAELLIVVMSVAFFFTSTATAGNNQQDIDVLMGTDLSNPTCTKSGNGTSLDIGGSCPTSGNAVITITPKGSGAARVEVVGNDLADDQWRMTNTVITANQAISNFHIRFMRVNKAGPTLPGPDEVWYKLSAKWTLSNESGNQASIGSYVENPVPSTPTPMSGSITNVSDPIIVTPGTNKTASAPSVRWTSSFSGDRRVIVDMELNLAQGAVLDFGNYVLLKSQKTPDKQACNSKIVKEAPTGKKKPGAFRKFIGPCLFEVIREKQ